MGILTLGLLGVAALFPVGSFYMQKAEIADNGSAVARSAMADVVARGLLDPNNWLVYGNDGLVQVSASGKEDPDGPNFTTNFNFARPLGGTLRQQLALLNSNVTLSPAEKEWCVNSELGSAYVLDPMGVAGATLPLPRQSNQSAYCFPATSLNMPVSYYADQSAAWDPWIGSGTATWPIRRVTFGQNLLARGYRRQVTATQWNSNYASGQFSSQDNLALELPDRDDLPARQNWLTVGGVPLARQWRGDYSWIVTVVPPTSEARDALAYGGRGHDYDVSVVVFYKRRIGATDPASNTELLRAAESLQQQERAVRAKVLSTSLSGGQLLLERPMSYSSAQADGLPTSPFDGLKVGEWLMVCGPHPVSTDADPRFALHWYRIVAIDGRDEPLDEAGNPTTAANQPERRLVTLRGPEWPWQPAADLTDDTALSNTLCAAICPGAVAVHTRTMQLESPSPWSAD